MSLTELARRMFRRSVTRTNNRAILAVECLEDRTVPSAVQAIADATSTHGLDPVTVSVLGNDLNSTEFPIFVTGWTAPDDGSLTFDGIDAFTFTPYSRFAAKNSTFEYSISNGHGESSTATVTINRVFWISPGGGSWSDPTNWNSNLVPNAEDGVSITTNRIVQVVNSVSVTVWGLITTNAELSVEGSLSVTNLAQLAGRVDVMGFGTVYNKTVADAGGTFVLSGGAFLSGRLDTAVGAVTDFTVAGNNYALLGAGDLTGGGLVRVLDAELIVSNSGETMANLAVLSGTVSGMADLTVTGKFMAQGARITGPLGTVLRVNSEVYITGAGMIASGRDLNEAAQAKGTIDGDLDLQDGQTTTLSGETSWNSGTIRIDGGSRLLNAGTFDVKGGNHIIGGTLLNGTPDGRLENVGTIEIKGAGLGADDHDLFVENIAFINRANGKLSLNFGDPGVIFSGGTGEHFGVIDGAAAPPVTLTEGADHTFYTGSKVDGELVVRNSAILRVPAGNSTSILDLILTGQPDSGSIVGAGASNLEITRTFNWDSGEVQSVLVKIASGATMKAFHSIPDSTRKLLGSTLTVRGKAEVTADLSVISGSRIVVDGSDFVGEFAVNEASITSDPSFPGLPMWVREGGTLKFNGGRVLNPDTGDPWFSVEVPVVLDLGEVSSRDYQFDKGYLQRGGKTTFSGVTVVSGHAPTNEGPGNNIRQEAIYVTAGSLVLTPNLRTQLYTDFDIAIKSSAPLDAGGTIQVGANKNGIINVEGVFTVAGDDTGDVSIQANLYLSGTTRVTVKNMASDYILISGILTISGELDVVEFPNAVIPDQRWTVFSAGNDLPAGVPKIIGDFDSVSNGYSYTKSPGSPPSKFINVIKGAS